MHNRNELNKFTSFSSTTNNCTAVQAQEKCKNPTT